MASRRRRHSNATIELLPGNRHTLPYDPETTTNFYLPDSSHSFGINIQSTKKKTIVNLHVIQRKPEFPERPISERDKSKVTETKPDFSEKPISERETSTVTQHKPEFSERPISDRETSTENNQSEQPTEKSTNQYAPVGNPSPQPDSDSGNGNKNPSISSIESDGNTDPIDSEPEMNLDLPIDEKIKYNNLFGKLTDENDMAYLDELVKNIEKTDRHKYAEYQLKILTERFDDKCTDESVKKKIKTYVNDFYVEKADKTRLLHATALHENPTGGQQQIKSLLKLCPEQTHEKRTGTKEGQNVLHILVYKKNLAGAKLVLESCSDSDVSKLLSSKAKYGLLKTRMMGETPLLIAALSFDKEMVLYLIDKGGVGLLKDTTSVGYTVFHALVRYAADYPEKKKDAKDMMEMINTILQNDKEMTRKEAIKTQLSLWYKVNDEGLTALQLAALLGQHELFKLMLELKDVYRKYKKIEDHIDCVRFDITELDYVALNHFRKSNEKKRENSDCFSRRGNAIIPASRETDTSQGKENATKIYPSTPSVIEIICETMQLKKAYKFINIPPINDIIDTKLKHYKGRLTIWFILHLGIMALLAGQAVVKALLINNSHQLMSTTQATTFLYVVSVILFVWGIIYLVLEGFRVYNRYPRSVFQDKRNWDYHTLLIVFSLCLVADAIWSWKQGPQNTYFLAIALVVGGWFLSFFSQLSQFFSAFTSMVRVALLGDGLRVIVIILFHFVAFSFAMYVLYLPTPGGPPAEFEHLGMTFLTMFTLMLSLTDLEILTRAPSPWLTVPLIIIFIVLTYILVLNILIAFITDTCSEMSKNREKQWKLQRLSMVVMIEQMVPLCWACNSAEGRDKNNQRFLSKRFQFEK